MAKKLPRFNNFTVRTMLTSFGKRSAKNLKKYDYPVYFQFKLGEDYQDDHYLYFRKKPTAEQYRNDIFNKIKESFPERVPDYLAFHFNAYQDDKNYFLSFLKIELTDRLSRISDEELKLRFKVALEWVEKMQQEIKPSEDFMDNGDFIHADIAKGISLNNKNHEARLFQLLVLICEIKAPGKTSTDMLFDNFTDINLCSILKTHFEKYRDLQVGTIRRNYLSKYRESFRREMPKAAKLEKALQDFFY